MAMPHISDVIRYSNLTPRVDTPTVGAQQPNDTVLRRTTTVHLKYPPTLEEWRAIRGDDFAKRLGEPITTTEVYVIQALRRKNPKQSWVVPGTVFGAPQEVAAQPVQEMAPAQTQRAPVSDPAPSLKEKDHPQFGVKIPAQGVTGAEPPASSTTQSSSTEPKGAPARRGRRPRMEGGYSGGPAPPRYAPRRMRPGRVSSERGRRRNPYIVDEAYEDDEEEEPMDYEDEEEDEERFVEDDEEAEEDDEGYEGGPRGEDDDDDGTGEYDDEPPVGTRRRGRRAPVYPPARGGPPHPPRRHPRPPSQVAQDRAALTHAIRRRREAPVPPVYHEFHSQIPRGDPEAYPPQRKRRLTRKQERELDEYMRFKQYSEKIQNMKTKQVEEEEIRKKAEEEGKQPPKTAEEMVRALKDAKIDKAVAMHLLPKNARALMT